MRVRVAGCGIAVALLLFACATAPKPAGHEVTSAAAPAVKVVITTDPAIRNYVDTAELTQLTQGELRRYAATAGPATVASRTAATTRMAIRSWAI